MPILKVGEKASFEKGNIYAQLKGLGEAIHIRLLGNPYYDGKHFEKTEDGWSVTPCNRIMNDGDCDLCNTYFDYMKQAKAEKNEEIKKDLTKKASKYKAKITFYYPIIDRKEEIAKIFQTSLSVRLKIDEEKSNGIDILKYDFIVKRTEKPGADYYSLTRLDSKDIKDFTDKEKEEIEKAKAWNLEDMVGGKESSQDLKNKNGNNAIELEDVPSKEEPKEESTEEVDSDEIPF